MLVRGNPLLSRILPALTLVAAFCLPSTPAFASRIRPDIRKLLDSQQPIPQFPPARAGWNGPEATPPSPSAVAMQLHRPDAVRAARASLLEAAKPDPWQLLAIAAAILLLRVLQTYDRKSARPGEVASIRARRERLAEEENRMAA